MKKTLPSRSANSMGSTQKQNCTSFKLLAHLLLLVVLRPDRNGANALRCIHRCRGYHSAGSSNGITLGATRGRPRKSKYSIDQRYQLEETNSITYPINNTLRLSLLSMSEDLPKVIDQNGVIWRTNRELMSERTRRDGLFDDRLPFDDTNKTYYHYMNLKPGKSMLRLFLNDSDVGLRSYLGTPILLNPAGLTIANMTLKPPKKTKKRTAEHGSLRLALTRRKSRAKPKKPKRPISSSHILEYRYVLDDERWLFHFQRLVNFKSKFNHTRVPQGFRQDPQLALWVAKQRWLNTQRERGEYSHLTDERKMLLESIDFDFDVNIDWEDNYLKLRSHLKKHGRFRVPFPRSGSGTSLARQEMVALRNWIRMQRQLHRVGLLSQEKIDLLNDINFDWDPYRTMWEARYAELKQFHERHGHCRVPREENKRLNMWMDDQRKAYGSMQRKDKKSSKVTRIKMFNMRFKLMTNERIEKLNALNFDWNPLDSLWQSRYQQLEAFKEQHGHANVPFDYDANATLGQWCRSQRQHYHAWKENSPSTMTPERLELLEKVGFDFTFNAFEDQWHSRYEELKEFHKEHGHCRVPLGYKPNPPLSFWVSQQRQQYKFFNQGKPSFMTPERMKLLNDLQIDWVVYESQWEGRYRELCEYQQENGHVSVSKKENSKLASWIVTQRMQYKLMQEGKSSGTLTSERVELLKQLGVSLDPYNEGWMQQYNALKNFKQKNGHCLVPRFYKEDESLGMWVSNQRRKKKDGSLTPEREKMLEEIGFNWSPLVK